MNVPNLPTLLEKVFNRHLGLFLNGQPILQAQWTSVFKGRWAAYKRLRDANKNRPYSDGSPCELEIIDTSIRGKPRPTVHYLKDEWKAHPVIKCVTWVKGEMRSIWKSVDENGKPFLDAGTNYGQLLDGSRFLIERLDYDTPRDVRRVTPWLDRHVLIMREFLKPSLESVEVTKMSKLQRASHIQSQAEAKSALSPTEFVKHYFFARMCCQYYGPKRRFHPPTLNERLMEKIYFNSEKRMIFFQFCCAEKSED